MKKLIVILTAIALVTSCTVIDPRVTGKRVVVAPDEEYESPYYDYGPYAYAYPMLSFGMGLWLSPFYWGSWWGPWGYPGWGYSSWWGYPGYGYPGWGGYYPGWGYPGYGYPYHRGNRIYRGQLQRGSTSKSGSRYGTKKKSTSRGSSGSSRVSKGSASGVRSGSSGRVSSGKSSGSGTRIKKK